MIPRILTRWLRLRREKRERLAFARFYASWPCPPSYAEPWLSESERKHWK